MRDTLNPPCEKPINPFAGVTLEMLKELTSQGMTHGSQKKGDEQVQGEDSDMNNREDVVPEEMGEGQINELVTPRDGEFGDTSDKWHYNELF